MEKHSFDLSNTVMETLGIEITEFTKERVVAAMEVTPKTHQPYGIMHGGVSVVLAETVASAGSANLIDHNTQRAVGLEINANHIHYVSEGKIFAVGTPIHVGKKTHVWDIKIRDENDKLICMSRCTMMVVDLIKL